MSTEEAPSDWKLKLRYGKLETPYKHFTAFADGRMTLTAHDFDCPLGPAWMALKTWAVDADQSADMIRVIGERLGFVVTGRVEIHESEPNQPPKEKPSGYDANFTPYSEDSSED
ncbi:MAG: hypothetical protein V4675_18720 [Verrucomicrobiota bacterium]